MRYRQYISLRAISNVKCQRGWSGQVAQLRWSTDGSKAGEGMGAGVYCEELRMNISLPLGTMATVFHSEIVALKECSKQLLGRDVKGRRIWMCTDSEASIKALSS